MKLTIERAALMRTLGHVQSVVERRHTIPLLSHVLIAAEADAVRFTATDLDVEMLESAPAGVERPGAATAPAHTLYDIVRKLPDGAQVALELSPPSDGEAAGRLTLKAGRSRFALPCLPPGDFPSLAADGLTCTFTLSADALARLIDKTRFAISTEETRYYLNGVHMHAHTAGDEPVLRVVATDGHRLALAESAAPPGSEAMPGVIVPRKTVQEVRRLLDDADGAVDVSVSESKIRFQIGDATLTSKLIEGSFPDYERVIPKTNDKTLVLDNKAFADAVDRVATISAEKTRSVKMSLEAERLTLAVDNPDTGQATEELPVEYAAEPLDIGFNAKYLLDVAGQIEGETAEFRLADGASPTLILDRGDDRAQYVLMPLRV